MNVRQIEAFRLVMLTGTVTAAAARLRISQPAVSRLISLLEARAGLKLFVRSKQRLHPTPEALLFHREVERSFIGLEKLERAASNIRTASSGSLRIASIPVVGIAFLPRVIARFRRNHPDVTISLQTRSSVTVIDWVMSSNYDLGFASSTPDQANLQSLAYASIPGVCILPARHRLARRQVVEAKDLEGEEFISLDPTDGNRVNVDRIFAGADVRRRLTLEAPYAAVIAAMVGQGLGVSVINPMAVLDWPADRLVARRFLPTLSFGFSLLYRKDIPMSLAARSFLAAMRDEMSEQFGPETLLTSI
jgi:DNA-binding transcriptional LysR family regulator